MFAPPENCGPSSFATMVWAPEKERLLFFAPRLGHLDWIQRTLEFLFRQYFFLACNFANSATGFRALLCDFGSAIVTNLRREAGHHCQRQLDQLSAALFVGYDAMDTFVTENIDYICEQPDRLEKIMRHYRHHDVELEVSVCAGPGNGRVVPDHLGANQHHRFAHHRIHLARHDRTAGLYGGKLKFADPAARPASEPADIVCNLEQADGNRF